MVWTTNIFEMADFLLVFNSDLRSIRGTIVEL